MEVTDKAAPAAEPGVSAFDGAIADVLSGLAPPADKPAEPAPQVDQAPANEAPKTAAAPAPAPEPPVEEKKVSSALATIADREKKMRDAHQARMSELQRKEQEIQAREAQITNLDKLRDKLLTSPREALKALGIDEKLGSQVAKGLYLESLGDDAPKEYREQKQFYTLQNQIAELGRKLEESQTRLVQQQEEARQRQAIDGYKAKLSSDIQKLPENLKFVRAYAAARPELVVEQLTNMAIKYAEANPYAEVPTAQQLAEMLEPELAGQLEPIVQHLVPKTTAPPAEQKQTAASKTLSNTALAAPSRPVAAPQTEEELLEQVVQGLKSLE